MTDRIDELKGAVKKTAGKATGQEDLEAEGATQQTAGKVSRETKGAANQAAGGRRPAWAAPSTTSGCRPRARPRRPRGKRSRPGDQGPWPLGRAAGPEALRDGPAGVAEAPLPRRRGARRPTGARHPPSERHREWLSAHGGDCPPTGGAAETDTTCDNPLAVGRTPATATPHLPRAAPPRPLPRPAAPDGQSPGPYASPRRGGPGRPGAPRGRAPAPGRREEGRRDHAGGATRAPRVTLREVVQFR